MHRAKTSGHASCKNKRFGCGMYARGDPKIVFGGMCLGTSASKWGRQEVNIIVAAGAKVHGCDDEATEPWFYGTLSLFSGPLNLFSRPLDLLLVLCSIFRLCTFFPGIGGLFVGPPWCQRKRILIYSPALVQIPRTDDDGSNCCVCDFPRRNLSALDARYSWAVDIPASLLLWRLLSTKAPRQSPATSTPARTHHDHAPVLALYVPVPRRERYDYILWKLDTRTRQKADWLSSNRQYYATWVDQKAEYARGLFRRTTQRASEVP